MQEIVLSEDFLVPTKSDIQNQVTALVGQVEDGVINPLRAYGLLAALEKMAGDAKKELTEAAITEAMKYPEKEIGVYGAKFQIKEAGVKYDFSNDPEWCDYQEQIDLVKAQQKGREATLKALKLCAKSSTTTLQVTLNK